MATVYLRNKIWWIKFRNPLSGAIVQKSLRVTDRKTAINYKKDLEARLVRGQLGFGYGRRVEPFLEEFFRYAQNHCRPRSLKRYHERANNFLAYLRDQGLESISLDEITPPMLEVYKSFRLKVAKPNTVNGELDFLRTVFNRAVAWGYLIKAPTRDVKSVPVVERSRVRWLTPEELQRICEKLKPEIADIVMFLAYTGLRRDEVAYLRWDDIINGMVRVRSSISKTARGREVPLCSRAKEILDRTPHIGETVFDIFVRNKNFRRNKLREYVKQAAERVGITDWKEVTTHTLRHTFASHLAMAGVSLYIIAQLLGHRDPSRTTTLYAHLAPNSLQPIVDSLPY